MPSSAILLLLGKEETAVRVRLRLRLDFHVPLRPLTSPTPYPHGRGAEINTPPRPSEALPCFLLFLFLFLFLCTSTATATDPSMEFHLHVQSRPYLSLLHTLERGSEPAAIFRLRLSEARRPLTYTPSGDIHIPDGAVLLERRVTLEELPSFLHPTQARKRIFEMLCFFLRGFPVTVRASTFHEWVAQVSDSVASSAAKALCVAPCSVTADVHICRLPEEGTGADGLGRALLASTEAYEREGSFGSLPALEAAIEELETTAYAGEGEDSCVICYEEFVPRKEVKKMPCGHLFHGGCIVPWLRRSHKCPLCRFEMPKEEAASAV